MDRGRRNSKPVVTDERKTEKKMEGDEEVDALLRAAEDELLLNLSINSHMARRGGGGTSSDYMDPDLDRRFNVLKLKSSPNIADDASARTADADDLVARFAALKTSIHPSSSPSSSPYYDPPRSPHNSGEEEDEVQKVIQWAIDAARLDPSPPTDDDDSAENISDDDDDDNGTYRHRKK
ncbi:uncharacterized protein LOC127809934 [Diospyros lotus]|uniref:uncharacterized protein LOC127809934 n=1 Tax=Diospyros lotus TaxID=55363 RepID=UPI002257780B|nr:uncharacterized protein LOC127809934 [Diospyros lotus]